MQRVGEHMGLLERTSEMLRGKVLEAYGLRHHLSFERGKHEEIVEGAAKYVLEQAGENEVIMNRMLT